MPLSTNSCTHLLSQLVRRVPHAAVYQQLGRRHHLFNNDGQTLWRLVSGVVVAQAYVQEAVDANAHVRGEGGGEGREQGLQDLGHAAQALVCHNQLEGHVDVDVVAGKRDLWRTIAEK